MNALCQYHDWLFDRIGVNPEDHEIECLCGLLLVLPFEAVLKEDGNIIESALYLRRTFIRDYDADEKRRFYQSMGPCSILEMLCVLLEKMSYMLIENPLASSEQGALFFELIDNLELGWINDRSFQQNPEWCNDYIEEAIQTFTYRDYDENGQNGGLFPVEHAPFDMREVGLYQQMDAYLIEKYDLLN